LWQLTENQDWFAHTMNHSTFVQHKLYLVVLLLLVFMLAACGGQPTATEEAADEPTAVEATEEAADEPTNEPEPTTEPTVPPVAAGVAADTFPCAASVIASEQSVLRIGYREPTSDESLGIGAARPNTPLRIDEMTEFEGVIWYRTANPQTNLFFGWVKAEFVNLSEECLAGGAAGDSEATEASDEATEEATEASDEPTEEATEESD
jgi:hypothetical protein